MSILNINEEVFQLRAVDFMEDPNHDLDVSIWAAGPNRRLTTYTQEMVDMNTWVLEKTEAIRKQILELDVVKPNGRQIRKILKNVLGINLSVRVNKYTYKDDDIVHAYYDIASNSERAFADRDSHIESDKLRYSINSIRIVINYPKMIIPAQGLKF